MWDQFWQSPEEEKPRIERIFSKLKENAIQTNHIMFLVMKSWNDNIVAYEYKEDENPIVKVTWISLQTEDVEKHRSKGNLSLRSTLSPPEDILYGCRVEIVEGDRYLIRINSPQLYDRTFEMVMDSKGSPAIIGSVNGVLCRLDYAYVQMKKGSIPLGDYMNLYGTNVSTGKKEVEKIMA